MVSLISEDIKNLKIQGATNVALATLQGLEEEAKDKSNNEDKLFRIGKSFAYVRPNEPLAQNALKFIFPGFSLQKVSGYKSLIEKSRINVEMKAEKLIQNGCAYFTHCHSTTVINMFKHAREKGLDFKVYLTETRPLFQGRKTARDLSEADIKKVTLMADSSMESILENKSINIKGVFVGADLLSQNGFVNKIGTLSLAILSQRLNIPFYSLSSLLKFKPGNFDILSIEQRDPKEVWDNPPVNLQIYNPAFDFIPYDLGVKLVTEEGIIEGEEIKEKVKKLYPFIK